MNGRPPTSWGVQAGTVIAPPAAPTDGTTWMTGQVQLGSANGATVTAVFCYTSAHATALQPVGSYQPGDTVLVQVLPTTTSSFVSAVVYGVLIPVPA